VKVLHIPYGYFPDVPGGTEVYVAALVRGLAKRGVESVIAAPTSSAEDASYVLDGTAVHRVAIASGARPLAALYGGGDHRLAAGLMRLVNAEQPDVVHFIATRLGSTAPSPNASGIRGYGS
jgi:hypothetical protein